MNKNWFYALNAVVAVGLVYFLLSSIDLNQVFLVVKNISLPVLALAALFYFAANLIGVYRLNFFMPEVGFKKFLGIHFASMLFSDVTPGRVGYSYLVFDLKERGLKASQSAKYTAVMLFSDFFARSIFLFSTVFLFAADFSLAGGFLLALSLAFLAFFFWRFDFVSKLASFVPVVGSRLKDFYNDFFSYHLKKRFLAYSIALSFAGAIPRGIEWLLVLSAVSGHGFGLLQIIVLTGVVTALSFIPVSIAGLGVQEGVGAFVLSSFLGISLIEAASALLLIRFLELSVDAVVGGSYWLFFKKRV